MSLFLRKHLFRILLFQIFSFIFSGFSQTADMHFEHLSLDEGIPHNLTNVIFQDSRGFIWFGTVLGLFKYDGYKYTTYRSILSDSTSISHNNISCIYEDKKGIMWIGTKGGGLNRLGPGQDKFIHYFHDPADSAGLSSNNINSVTHDYEGNLWIGTENGLNKLSEGHHNSGTETHFERYYYEPLSASSLSDNYINVVFEDLNRVLWIGTNNGLNYYIPGNETFGRYYAFDSLATLSYVPQFWNMVDSLKKKTNILSSIMTAGPNADKADTFYVKKNTSVLINAMGEGRASYASRVINKLSDKGWLEKAGTGVICWEFDYQTSLYAGGAQKNRVKSGIVNLLPGKYILRYQTDGSHHYGSWNNLPPHRPSSWGIEVLSIKNDQIDKLDSLLKERKNNYKNSLSGNTITAIAQGDDSSILWIGAAWGGLNKFDTRRKKFKSYRYNPQKTNSIVSYRVKTICRDTTNLYWIGTNDGLSFFNSETEKFTNFRHDPLNPQSISSNSINSIIKDRSGIIWLGTYWGGVDKLFKKQSRFPLLKFAATETGSRPINNIFAVHADSKDNLWLGTGGAGLLKYNLKTKLLKNYIYDIKNRSSLSYNYISAAAKADETHLWIGTHGRGLNKFNTITGISQRFYHDADDPGSISSSRILSLLQDSKGRLWIGTDTGGLSMLKPGEKKFIRYQHNPEDENSISSNSVFTIYEDKYGTIWLGTSRGLDQFDEASNSFRNHSLKKHTKLDFYDGKIFVLAGSVHHQDTCLWAGTSKGLARFHARQERFEYFIKFPELSNNVISGIEEGADGYVWISTIKGLVKFNPEISMTETYDYRDGLQSNIFNVRSHTKLKKGEIIFGGINGLNMFHPGNINPDVFKAPVYITDFEVFYEKKPIKVTGTGRCRVELGYSENFFTIEFAALDYTNPSKNQYLYRLSRVDKDWMLLKNGHSASYTNVPPGKYLFEVKGSNSSGYWNDETAALEIIIKPPFWLTAWFKMIIGLFVVIAIASIVIFIQDKEKKRSRLNKQISELKLQALRARMNPHFIFNTINSIQYLISENDQESAYFYLSKFSKLLRLTLHLSEESSVPLQEELDMLNLYLEMQELRFENRFKFSIEIDNKINVKKVKVPTMIIQPYVENAIEHGLSENGRTGNIQIKLEKKKDLLVCHILDDGIGYNKSLQLKKQNNTAHKSKGMQLTKERLRIINHAREKDIDVAVIDLHDSGLAGSGTQVTIHIPI